MLSLMFNYLFFVHSFVIAIIQYLTMKVTIYINYVIFIHFIVLFEPLRHVACIYSLQTTKPTLKKELTLATQATASKPKPHNPLGRTTGEQPVHKKSPPTPNPKADQRDPKLRGNLE
jgi:hypothetical protein